MNKNVIKDETKPTLTSGEKKRFPDAAKYFIEGGKKFYENYVIQVKQTVSDKVLRGETMNVLRSRVDEVKNNIQKKVEKIKQDNEERFGNKLLKFVVFLEKVIIGVYLFGDKIKKFSIEHQDYLFKFVRSGKMMAKHGLSEIQYFFKTMFGYKDTLAVILDKVISSAFKIIYAATQFIISGIWNFFNGERNNIFVDLLKKTTAIAADRANGISGIMMDLFGDALRQEIRKRPTLKEFFKFGADVVNEVNRINETFDQIFSDVGSLGDGNLVAYYKHGNVREDYIDIVNESSDDKDEREDLIKVFKGVGDDFLKLSKTMAVNFKQNEILSELKPVDLTEIKKRINMELEKEYDAGNTADTWVPEFLDFNTMEFKLKKFKFQRKTKPLALVEAENRVKYFLLNHQLSDDVVVKQIRDEWEIYNKSTDAYKLFMIKFLITTIVMFESTQRKTQSVLENSQKYDSLYNKIDSLEENQSINNALGEYYSGYIGFEDLFAQMSEKVTSNLFGDLRKYSFLRSVFNLDDSLLSISWFNQSLKSLKYTKNNVNLGNVYFISESGSIDNLLYGSIENEETTISENQGKSVIGSLEMMVEAHNKVQKLILDGRDKRVKLLNRLYSQLIGFPSDDKHHLVS